MSKTQTTTNYAMLLDSSVELDDSTKSGKFKHFSKMLASYGQFVDPRGGKKPMILDKSWAQKIVDNFSKGPIKRVPMVMGHPQTSAELAEKTRGWLQKLEAREDGLYGIFDIRRQDTAEDIEKGLLEQTSVAFDDNYQDKRTGKWYQNVLKHVGLVNDPYIRGMEAMEPVEMSDSVAAAVLFSDAVNNNEEEEVSMTKIKNDRDFPVEVTYKDAEEDKKVAIEPGAEVEIPEDQVEAVTKQVADAEAPKAEDDDDAELSDKEKELAEREAAAAKKEAELAEREANTEYERLLSEGKIVPAQKDAFIALSSKGSASVELSDGKEKTVSVLLAELFEAAPASTRLSEKGKDDPDSEEEDDDPVELSNEEKSFGDDFGNTPAEIAEFKKTGKVTTKKDEE